MILIALPSVALPTPPARAFAPAVALIVALSVADLIPRMGWRPLSCHDEVPRADRLSVHERGDLIMTRPGCQHIRPKGGIGTVGAPNL